MSEFNFVTDMVELIKQTCLTAKLDNLDVIEEGLTHLWRVILEVNRTPDYATRVLGLPMSEILIPSWSKVFLSPMKVTLTGGAMEHDIRVLPEIPGYVLNLNNEAADSEFKYNVELMESLKNYINKAYKKTVGTLKPVSEMRPGATTFNNLIYASDGRVFNMKDWTWPIEIAPEIAALLGDFVDSKPLVEVQHMYILRKFSFDAKTNSDSFVEK